MNMIKKILFLLMGLWICTQYLYAQNMEVSEPFYYGKEYQGDTLWGDQKTELATIIKNDTLQSKDTNILYKIRQYFRLTWTSTYDQAAPATAYIAMILNILLGLTSFISLVLVIFAFYLIFFSKGDDGVAKAKKILTGVAIALVIMWLSWIIVSFFFNIYTTQVIKSI